MQKYNYIYVGKDKILHRYYDVAENSAFGNINNALIYILFEDWEGEAFVGPVPEGQTFKEVEAAYIKERGWIDEDTLR